MFSISDFEVMFASGDPTGSGPAQLLALQPGDHCLRVIVKTHGYLTPEGETRVQKDDGGEIRQHFLMLYQFDQDNQRMDSGLDKFDPAYFRNYSEMLKVGLFQDDIVAALTKFLLKHLGRLTLLGVQLVTVDESLFVPVDNPLYEGAVRFLFPDMAVQSVAEYDAAIAKLSPEVWDRLEASRVISPVIGPAWGHCSLDMSGLHFDIVTYSSRKKNGSFWAYEEKQGRRTLREVAAARGDSASGNIIEVSASGIGSTQFYLPISGDYLHVTVNGEYIWGKTLEVCQLAAGAHAHRAPLSTTKKELVDVAQ